MANRRKPDHIHVLNGTYRKDRHGNLNEKLESRGDFPKDPPEHLKLSPSAKQCWNDIARLTPLGILTASDVLIVEIIASLLAEFRRAPAAMQASRISRLSIELGKLGLSPSDRSKLHIPQTRKPNKFDGI